MSDKRDNLIRYGKLTTAMDANSQKITGLAAPTADADAATKKYVDDAAQGSLVDYSQVQNKPQINGTTLQSGNNALTGADIPVSASDPTKVDAAIAGKRGKSDLAVYGYALPSDALPITDPTGVYDLSSYSFSGGRVTISLYDANGAEVMVFDSSTLAYAGGYAPILFNGRIGSVANSWPVLNRVATSDTLAKTSELPTIGTTLAHNTATAVTGGTIWSHIWGALTAIPDSAASLYAWITAKLNLKVNTADLAAVATSGSYDDLSDTPTIPAAQVQSNWNETDATSKAFIQNKPTIPTVPTNVSAFTNDSGYITATAIPYTLGSAITASAQLADRTANLVIAEAANATEIALTFPAAVTGKVRDFSILVKRETGNTGGVSVTTPTGAVTYGDGFSTAVAEGKTVLYSVTEVAANEWYIRAIEMEVAS